MMKMNKLNDEKRVDIYQMVTDKIVAILESENVGKWLKNWKVGKSCNAESKREYSGINSLLLQIEANIKDYPTNSWLTFKQVSKLGGKIKKGGHGTFITYYNLVEIEVENKEGELEKKKLPILRYFFVFNVAQIENLPEEFYSTKAIISTDERISNAEELISTILKETGIQVKFGGGVACYNLISDKIKMPKFEVFNTPMDFYATYLHELVHSTGNKNRLNRDSMITKSKDSYAFEELIAEIGSSFLNSCLGVSGNIQNHANYIASWLVALKNDKKAIFKASRLAQEASNYLLKLGGLKEDENNGG